MAYTVKKLSELSGVTIRTLHFYEEVGLLKPAYYGSNRYRYYEEKQLLELQQILFFKNLGFSLKQIQKVLGQSDFNQLAALHSHKKGLIREREKVELLIKTIDKTINHLQGKKKMKDKEMFQGLAEIIDLANKDETYFEAEALVLGSVKNPVKSVKDAEDKGKVFYEKISKTAHSIFKELVQCIEKELDPSSSEVQQIIKKHYLLIGQIHEVSPKVYKALAKLYLEHSGFRKQLDPFHPELAAFMSKAMCLFVDKKTKSLVTMDA